MTVGSKLQQTIASIESASASLKQFSLDTQDPTAKQMYNQLAQTLDNAKSTLQARMNYIQQQEPQYKQS